VAPAQTVNEGRQVILTGRAVASVPVFLPAPHDSLHPFMTSTLTETLALTFRHGFLRDAQFQCALVAAPLTLLAMNWLTPEWSVGIHANMATLLLLVLWQPVMEEILFRGIIQGYLHSQRWVRLRVLGLSAANCMTTVLFVCAHLVQHSAGWALAVAVPSLVFGHFRDRHNQIYPAILLHAVYNACYLLFGQMNNG
jgi:uncharacterized protein